MTTSGLTRTTGLAYLIMILTASTAYYIWRRLTDVDRVPIVERIRLNQRLFTHRS